MAPEFVFYPAAASGTGPCPVIRKEACGFADLGRFNLWRPMVVDRTGGSKWNRALPGACRHSQQRRF